jgi:AcrR family transcriptional regulator
MGIAERKQRELQRREQDILEAAMRLFAQEDWQQVTIERIAQEAEIGKGTVYLHFPSKEEIYARLALDFSRQVLERLHAIDRKLPVPQKLRAAIHVFFSAHSAGPHLQRVCEYCDRDDFRRRIGAESRAELERVDAEIVGLIHAVLQQGIAEGVFADRPIPVLLYGAHSTVVGALRLFQHNCLGGATPADAEEEITRFVLAGLMYLDRVDMGGESASGALAQEAARQEGH